MKRPRVGVLLAGALTLLGVLAGVLGVPTAASQATTLTAVGVPDQPPLDPDWSLWAKVPGIDVPLTAQQIVYPNGGGAVPSVNLKAVHYNGTLYIRASWQDATQDASTLQATDFADAVALEFPAKSAVTVPSFCMGQANAGVNIWQWRADTQADVDQVAVWFPNAYSDSYPTALEDDPIYQPARALGNPVALAGGTPVQNLVAQAFGTLERAAAQDVQGKGVWKDGRWSVVFARPFAGGAPDQAEFAQGVSTSLAVAVWDGARGDRDGQKSVSQFVTLSLSGAQLRPGAARDWSALWLALLLGGGAVLFGLALLAWLGMTSLGRRRV